jgi:hypothetical protein
MAQTGYTPIQLYYSTTPSAVPSAGNLASGEVALNIADGKMYFKDTGGTVQPLVLVPAQSGNSGKFLTTNGTTSSWSQVPLATAVSGTLPIANGGTGTSSTTFVDLISNVSGILPINNGGTGTNSTTFANLATNVTGTLPITNGGTGTSSTTFANLTTNVAGILPITNGGTGTSSTTFANLTTNVTGTLPVSNGGTGATSFTKSGVLLGNTTGAVQATNAGTSGQVLTSNGVGVDPTFQNPPSGLINGTLVNTTSGQNIDFSSIPSNVKLVVINFSGVQFSTSSGTPWFQIQIGASGGIEVTGYTSYALKIAQSGVTTATSATSCFSFDGSSSGPITGMVYLRQIDSVNNIWIASGDLISPTSGQAELYKCSGTKTISGGLTRVRITNNATGNFSAGKINIQYM